MTFLVDANVLSEPTKLKPEPQVVEWLRRNERQIVVNPIILSEIRFGIEQMPAGKRRKRFEDWFNEGVKMLPCLPFEATSGIRWAELLSKLYSAGKRMPVQDSLIAATALEYGLTVATRNSHDFRNAGVKVVNPFA